MQAVHMTWLPLSKEGKFHRMRDGMLYTFPVLKYECTALCRQYT